MSNCNGLPCGGYTGSYLNVTNLPVNCGHEQSCSGCIDIVKTECIKYTDVNLVHLGVSKDSNLNEILVRLNTIKGVQDAKNAALLAAINNLNTRLNTLTGGVPFPPYTIS